MVDFKLILAAIVAILSVYCYNKIAPNIPKLSEGVLFYYKCSNFSERKLLEKGSRDFEALFGDERQIFVLIPGYTESTIRRWVQIVSEELIKANSEACVILVEHWNYLELSRPYMEKNVQKIGQDIADLLLASGKSLSSFHVIGFSLGGWVAGCISNFLPKEKQLGRITGLDPSFPWQDTDNPDNYLDSSDADVVVVLRTSRTSLKIPRVKYDFTVNDGRTQPECNIWYHPDFIQQICSHYKAHFLFASHLTEKEEEFQSCRCSNRTSLLEGGCPCLVRNTFGLNTVLSLPGTYFLEEPSPIKDK